MSGKIVKVVTGLLLGVVVTLGVKASVNAEVIYLVKDDGVFAVDDQTYLYTKMPAGAIIPEGSKVLIDRDAAKTMDADCGTFKVSGGSWCNPVFTATSNLKVGYGDEGNAIFNRTFNVYGTGEDMLGVKAMEIQARTAYYINSKWNAYVPGYSIPTWPAPCAPVWTAPAPCAPTWNITLPNVPVDWSVVGK